MMGSPVDVMCAACRGLGCASRGPLRDCEACSGTGFALAEGARLVGWDSVRSEACGHIIGRWRVRAVGVPA